MTEIPEHLLQASRARRVALGLINEDPAVEEPLTSKPSDLSALLEVNQFCHENITQLNREIAALMNKRSDFSRMIDLLRPMIDEAEKHG